MASNTLKEADAVAGHVYLTRALQTGLKTMLEMDSRLPRFHKIDDPDREHLGENPNAVFYAASLDPAKSYLVRGRVLAEDYFSVTVKSASCTGCFFKNTVAVADDKQLKMGESNRKFELFVSAQPPPGNFQGDWISLGAAPRGLPLQLIAQYYYENLESMPQFHDLSITLADPESALALPNPRAAIPSDAEMARKLRAVKTFIQKHTQARERDNAYRHDRLSSESKKTQNKILVMKSITADVKGGGALDPVRDLIKYWRVNAELKPVETP